MTMHDPIFQRAVAHHQQRQFAEAVALCRQLLQRDPSRPDVLHLYGMCEKALGNSEAAIAALERCLKVAPLQPEVWVNLGNLQAAQGLLPVALNSYQQALAVSPNFANAWYNLALICHRTGDYREAVAACERLLALQAQHAGGCEVLALSLWKLQRFATAREAFDRALVLSPNSGRLHFNAGNFCRDDGRPEQAIYHYQLALSLGLHHAELFEALAGAQAERGDFTGAMQTFTDVLEQQPQQARLHYARAKLRWETGQSDAAEAGLQQALAEQPGNADLWGYLAEWLSHQGRFEDLQRMLPQARIRCEWTPRLAMAEAVTLSTLGQQAAATACFERLLANDPDGVPPNLAYAEHLLKVGDPARAASLCEVVLRSSRFDQRALAFLGVAWQLLNDPRATWLLDYQQMVMPSLLPVPPQWPDRAAFMAAVGDELEQLHVSEQHPLEQTLRGGTQTNGFLFRDRRPALQALRGAIEQAVQDTVAGFPDDPAHPFWSRKTQQIRLKGAWSVRLRDQGFHTNHFHPEGWISSALYVALPQTVRTGSSTEGHIQFGQPPVELGLSLPAARVVPPAEGLLVLFPSYMWHGTVPFSASEPRLTVAFDVLPG